MENIITREAAWELLRKTIDAMRDCEARVASEMENRNLSFRFQ